MTACTEAPETCGQPHSLFLPRPIQLGLAGAEQGVVVRALCVRPGASVTSVDVTVRGPAGEAVPFTVSEPKVEDETSAVTVSFVPSLGNSTVSVEFEPNLGAAEVMLIAMRDRSHEPPVAELDLLRDCDDPHHARSLTSCVDSTLHVFFDGGLFAEAPRSRAIEGNEVLWSWNDGGVTRWLGTGRLEFPMPAGEAAAVSADDERLVLDRNGDLWEFTVADGGMELARAPLLLSAGLGEGFFHPPIAVDGGWVFIDQANKQSCFKAPTSALSCAPFDYPVTSAEGDGFWVDDGRIGFARFGAGPHPVEFLSITLPRTTIGGERIQSYAGQVFSIRPNMELELWPAFPGNVRVRPRYVYGYAGAHVTIFER